MARVSLHLQRHIFRITHDVGKLLRTARRFMTTDADLGKRSYWEKRYSSGDVQGHDWLASGQSNFADILCKIEHVDIPVGDYPVRLLDIGCGVSELPGYVLCNSKRPVHAWCLDYTKGAIEWQSEHIRSCIATNNQSKMAFVVGDACHLPFKNEFFHVIVDKGTLDSLLKIRNNGKYFAAKMLRECSRVLHQQGRLFQITDEDPDVRLLLLEEMFKELAIPVQTSYSSLSHLDETGYEYFMYIVLFL